METVASEITPGIVPVDRVKLQFGVVFNVYVCVPKVEGVPVALSTTVFEPVGAEKVPDAEKVTPTSVVEVAVKLYVPTVVTFTVMVCVTVFEGIAVPCVMDPTDEVEQS